MQFRQRYKLLRMYAVYKVATSAVNYNFVLLQLLTCSCITNFLREPPQHMLIYCEEESLTSIVKASQIVEPLQPKKGSKSKRQMGQKSFTCHCFGSRG